MAGAGTQSVNSKALRFVIRDVLFDILRFPIWWYTTGTVQAARFFVYELRAITDRLSIRILLRNFFKPMYGDYTRSGRIISFFMRLFVFVFRLIGLVIWSAVLCALFAFWLLVIPLVLYRILYQLSG